MTNRSANIIACLCLVLLWGLFSRATAYPVLVYDASKPGYGLRSASSLTWDDVTVGGASIMDTFVDVTGDSMTGQLQITTAGATVPLRVVVTDDTATSKPITIYRNSASPADNDMLSGIDFKGNNSAGAEVEYVTITPRILTNTAGAHRGELDIDTTIGGVMYNVVAFARGILPMRVRSSLGAAGGVVDFMDSSSQTNGEKLLGISFSAQTGSAAVNKVLLVPSIPQASDSTGYADFSVQTLNTGTMATRIKIDYTGIDVTGDMDASGAMTAGALSTVTVSGLEPLKLVSSEASSDASGLGLYRSSVSPVANDNLMGVNFYGKDVGGNNQLYASIMPVIDSTDLLSYDGHLDVYTTKDTTSTKVATFKAGTTEPLEVRSGVDANGGFMTLFDSTGETDTEKNLGLAFSSLYGGSEYQKVTLVPSTPLVDLTGGYSRLTVRTLDGAALGDRLIIDKNGVDVKGAIYVDGDEIVDNDGVATFPRIVIRPNISISVVPGGVTYSAGLNLGNVGTAEDDLTSWTLTGGALGQNNEFLRIHAFGTFNTVGATARLYFNGTELDNISAAATDDDWSFEAVVIRTGAATQTCSTSTSVGTSGDGGTNVVETTATLSGDVVIKVTGDAVSASNEVKIRGLIIGHFGAP
jgi:hypothetical protein